MIQDLIHTETYFFVLPYFLFNSVNALRQNKVFMSRLLLNFINRMSKPANPKAREYDKSQAYYKVFKGNYDKNDNNDNDDNYNSYDKNVCITSRLFVKERFKDIFQMSDVWLMDVSKFLTRLV